MSQVNSSAPLLQTSYSDALTGNTVPNKGFTHDELRFFESIAAVGAPICREKLAKIFKKETSYLSALDRYSYHSTAAYTRHLIYQTAHFEALVLTWLPGQRSPIHNHRGSVCGMLTLKGTATEIAFAQSENETVYPSVTTIFPGDTFAISEDSDMHMIANLNKDTLITLHIYSPSLTNMEIFDLDSSVFSGYEQLIQNTQRK